MASLALLLALALAAPQQPAPDAAAPVATAPYGAVDAAARAEFEAQALVGLAVALVAEGRVVHEVHMGHANREDGVPVGPETLFRWASISKPVTAIAAMQLARAGKLDLDRDVREYVPEFPAKPWPITSRQLLCHQGGVVHYTNGEVVRTRREYDAAHPFEDVVTALDMFKESPLVAEPGTSYSYTTHGYMLLGAVVQRAGGEAFWPQVRARVAEPAGMTSFQPDYQRLDLPGRAVGYRRLGDLVARSTDTDVSWKLAGGGFVSTVGDLARFAAALLDERLLPRDVLETMWTNQATRDGKRTGYGLGFGVSTADGERRVAHTGSQEKTRTLMHVYPAKRRAVVVMSNCEWAQCGPVADRVLEAWGTGEAR